ncbi:META domain-containing protein [Sphingopyxis lindanitolerans]|uniref:META domain-containing protein n=1 Tax=Sphingopyxis lindanitolerans TaxID=2054227 RepID=A0A2S8B191_9SPHN|nr:META domain-containing protein [Sphingopyxis lindanitolerans]PQM26152.1 META domain-containing protein [Sphingopyxis lindanitolerans]
MTRILPLIALPLVLAGCAASGTPQAPGEKPAPAAAYMAVGTEPGWTLEITPERLSYAGDYGETKIAVPNPGATSAANGQTYATGRLSVAIEHRACSDGMSDRRYADTVRVTADGKTVQGCGGAILPPDTLAGSNWTFVSIGGAPVAPDRPTSLAFDGTRLSGSAGCNRFSGGYTADGRALTAGPLMATKMACPGAGMDQERAFFSLMATPVSIGFPSDGTMEITGTNGQTAVLRRAI